MSVTLSAGEGSCGGFFAALRMTVLVAIFYLYYMRVM